MYLGEGLQVAVRPWWTAEEAVVGVQAEADLVYPPSLLSPQVQRNDQVQSEIVACCERVVFCFDLVARQGLPERFDE